MKNRSRTEIIADILRTLCNGPATRTQIMYGAFLSYSQALDFLDYLVDRAMVVLEPGTSLYFISERGMELMDASDGFQNLVDLAPFDRVGANF